MDDPIDERFAYITHVDGKRYQVLRYATDESGERLLDENDAPIPIDWDEQATAASVRDNVPVDE